MTIRRLFSRLLPALFAVTLFPATAMGQTSFYHEYRSSNGQITPTVRGMVQHPDSGYTCLWQGLSTNVPNQFLGVSHLSPTGDEYTSNLLVLGDSSLEYAYPHLLYGTQGELFLTGSLFDSQLDAYSPFAIRLDSQTLAPQWAYSYPVPGFSALFFDATPLANGDLLLFGQSAPPPNTSLKLYSSITRITSDGTLVWHRDQTDFIMTTGGTLEAANGDLLIAGHIVDTAAAYTQKTFLARLDSSGNTLWSRHYGGPDAFFAIDGLHWGANDTILAWGTAAPGNSSILPSYAGFTKFAPDGQWTSTRNYREIIHQQFPRQADANGFTTVASTYDYGHRELGTVLFRYNLHGNLLWSRYYSLPYAVDSADHRHGYAVLPLGQDGYLVADGGHQSPGWAYERAGIFNTDTFGLNSCNSFPFLPTDTTYQLASDTFAYIDTILPAQAISLPVTLSSGLFDDSYLCTSECVWPGDAYHDGIANHEDLLAIGLTYGFSDSARMDTSNAWTCHHSFDWSGNFLVGTNWKHADCNGDGVVNADDTLAIQLNYGQTHNKGALVDQGSAQDPPLLVVIPTDTAYIGDTIHAPILLGSQDIPIDSIYGLAFTLLYDQGLVDTNSAWISYDSSWFGDSTNTIGLYHDFWALGSIDGAITRINHTNAAGYSQIATLHIILIDNIEGKRQASDVLHIGFGSYHGIALSQEAPPLSSGGDSVVVVDPELFQQEHHYLPGQIKVYPNPAGDLVYLSSENGPIREVRLVGQNGQLIIQGEYQRERLHLEIEAVPSGFYILSVRTRHGWTHHKLVIR